MDVILLWIAVYFLPSIIALAHGKRSAGPIVVVNVFLGWTFVAWVLALAWSVAPEAKAA